MTQLFGRNADRKLRRGAALVVVLAVSTLLFGYFRVRSDSYWHVGTAREQPVPFNHKLHVQGLKMECGYCHTGATSMAGAGMPSAQNCLTCHSEIWRGVPALEPLHTSAELGTPIPWNSVIWFPDHARFHHGSHIAAGVACSTCHGDVGAMTETSAAVRLTMDFCVDCHEDAMAETGSRESAVTALPAAAFLQRKGSASPAAEGMDPPASHQDGRSLTDCSVCHY